MRKRVLGFGLLLLLLCGASVFALAYPSLLPAANRSPRVAPRDLLVGLPAYPDDWGIGEGPGPARPPRDVRLGDESAVIWLQPRGRMAFAHQQVMHFRNAAAAAYAFQQLHYLGGVYPEEPDLPPGWAYRSPHADDWAFGCAYEGERIAWCTAIGRYDEFVSLFIAHGPPDGLTPDEFERVLGAIDDRASVQLGR